MTEFVEWRPTHDGHKPPFWVDGMVWQYFNNYTKSFYDGEGTPYFNLSTYRVPREAVCSPHEDAGSIDPVLYERMAEVIKLLAMEVPYYSTDEIKAIAAELEPVDPLLQLAREVCSRRWGCGDKIHKWCFRSLVCYAVRPSNGQGHAGA